MLVDFPWGLLMNRSLVQKRLHNWFKSDFMMGYRQIIVERLLQPEENFRAASRDAFFHFGERALGGLEHTPLNDASMVIEGFGERRMVSDQQSNLTIQVASEYDVHTLLYHDDARRRFNGDLNNLVLLGG